MFKRQCNKCKVFKDKEDFQNTWTCKLCFAVAKEEARQKRLAFGKEYRKRPEIQERSTERNKAKYKEDPERQKFLSRLSARGISEQDYFKLLEEQGSKCGICEVELGVKLHIDHCHETNKIRGLLCHKCNTGLGHLGDNIQGLEKALEYLRRNK